MAEEARANDPNPVKGILKSKKRDNKAEADDNPIKSILKKSSKSSSDIVSAPAPLPPAPTSAPVPIPPPPPPPRGILKRKSSDKEQKSPEKKSKKEEKSPSKHSRRQSDADLPKVKKEPESPRNRNADTRKTGVKNEKIEPAVEVKAKKEEQQIQLLQQYEDDDDEYGIYKLCCLQITWFICLYSKGI